MLKVTIVLIFESYYLEVMKWSSQHAKRISSLLCLESFPLPPSEKLLWQVYKGKMA